MRLELKSGGEDMRRTVIGALCVFLAFFVFSSPFVKAESVSAEVVYRQSFSDVSSTTSAGIAEGERNTASSEVNVYSGYLHLSDLTGDRAFALLPFYNSYTDYTVRFSFSFTETVRSSGYVSIMLTSKGDAPDNITAVKIRADGECEGFSLLSQRLIHSIKKGEEVSVSVPITGGVLDCITLSADGVTETVYIDNIVDVVDGRIGFSVRNCAVRISEVAVVDGVGYNEETGIYTEASTWTDDAPYVSAASYARRDISLCSVPAVDVIDSVAECTEAAAPETSDSAAAFFVISSVSLAALVHAFGRKRIREKTEY